MEPIGSEELQVRHVRHTGVSRVVERAPVDSPVVEDEQEDVIAAGRAECQVDVEAIIVEGGDIDEPGAVELPGIPGQGPRVESGEAAVLDAGGDALPALEVNGALHDVASAIHGAPRYRDIPALLASRDRAVREFAFGATFKDDLRPGRNGSSGAGSCAMVLMPRPERRRERTATRTRPRSTRRTC